MKSNKERIIECLRIYEESFTAEEIQGATTQYLSNKLHLQRSNISAILNTLVKEGSVEKVNGRPVLYRLERNKEKQKVSCFEKLIGYEGSLKRAVQLAKAAVLYPNHSLHSLIIGAGGAGKTYFASLMYEFAMESGIIQEGAPFITFDCLNYISDDRLMEDMLFQNAKQSCLKQAHKGILFIDHVEYLSQEAKDTLFHLMDNELMLYGKSVDTIVICALDDGVSTFEKETFLGKFSILIHLPPLQERSLTERMKMIHYFLSLESMRTKRNIKIDSSCIRLLLLYECKGNIKQLKKDIQIGCANAYVREFNQQRGELPLTESDFPIYIRKGILNYRRLHKEVDTVISQDSYYIYSNQKVDQVETSPTQDAERRSIYDVIDQKSKELRNRGIKEYDINRLISVDIENEFNEYTRKLSGSIINKEHLRKIVDNEIISMVDEFLEDASRIFHCIYPISTFYGLCLHLSNTLKNHNRTQQLSNERIMEIVEKHKEEYALCTRFVSKIEKQYHTSLPIDEVIFITMFLCDSQQQEDKGPMVQVLIAMHGRGNASSMAAVVNDLVQQGNVSAYDLPLDKEMQEAYEEIKQILLDIDQGSGILFLYDMGSLKVMAEMIQQETNCKLRMMELPATLIAMDCARKAASDQDIDTVYEQVMDAYQLSFTTMKKAYHRTYDKQIIITLCMSGKGGAVQMKHYIEKYLDFEDIDILPFAISDRAYLLNEVNRLQKESHILCVIGTYDPQLFAIPFVSITQLYETPLENLRSLLISQKKKLEYATVNYEEIYAFLKEQMEDSFVEEIKTVLPGVLEMLCLKVPDINTDQRLGLFLHLSCCLDRLRKGEPSLENKQKKTIIQRNKKLYACLREILLPLEETFSIQLSDDEIAYLMTNIKKL